MFKLPASSAAAIYSQERKKAKVRANYLQFPLEYTEEELMLQNKYQKLRRKKIALQKYLKSQTSIENESTTLDVLMMKSSQEEARDAKELAKKLVKTGAISINKPLAQMNEGFKKSLGLERKMTSEKPVSCYKPFEALTNEQSINMKNTKKTKANAKSLYDSFVAACGDKRDANTNSKKNNGGRGGTRGQTICVIWKKITPTSLQQTFSAFGNIMNILMETNNRGFVTFEKIECAEKAINELDGKEIDGDKLKVTFAWKQPLEGQNNPQDDDDDKQTRVDTRQVIGYYDPTFDVAV